MSFSTHINKALFTPIKAIKKRYVPLLMIYFAYGLSGFSAIALSFWEKENIGLSAEQLIEIGVWAFLPWTLKMVFGQMVDSVKIFGSRRKIYVFIGAVFMILGSVILASMASELAWIEMLGGEYNAYLLAALCSTLGFVIQDVTADTMTTEVVDRTKILNNKCVHRSEEEIQSDLAMVQVLGRLALSLAAFSVAGLGGYLADTIPYATIFWMTLIIPVVSCLGAIFINLDVLEGAEAPPINAKILGGGLAFGAFSISMKFFEVPYSQEIVFVVSLLLLSAMLMLVTKNISAQKKKLLIFALIALFLYRATPSTGPGLQWWSIDELGFDPKFFGVLAQTGSAMALIFLWFFADFIAKKPVRSVLIFLIIVETIMSVPELMLYYDVHTMLGIPARTLALFDTAVGSPLVHVSMVPMLALIAFYAPAGYRGTWFAIGASLMNLALTAGSLGTKYLNKFFVISREVLDEAGEVITAANYDDLGVLMIIRMSIALIIPLAGILIFLKKTPKNSQPIPVQTAESGPIPGRERVEP